MNESAAPADEKMLCYCLGVRYGQVREAIVQEGCRNVTEVMLASKAGGGCRSCHPEIEEEIARQKALGKGARRGFFARLFRR